MPENDTDPPPPNTNILHIAAAKLIAISQTDEFKKVAEECKAKGTLPMVDLGLLCAPKKSMHFVSIGKIPKEKDQ